MNFKGDNENKFEYKLGDEYLRFFIILYILRIFFWKFIIICYF